MINSKKLVLLTTPEVALLLRTQPGTLRHWRCAGKGPRWVKIGGKVRYLYADLQRYVANGRPQQQIAV